MKSKFISLLLIICIILTQLTAFAAVKWPAASSHGRDLPNRPTDGYVSMQNPPGFTWQYVKDAVSYELCIYTDDKCTKKKYSKEGLVNNYYNFDKIFEAGKTYWWRVRYYTADGSNSEWTPQSRFRIDPDAYEFTVPETSVLKPRVYGEHPRVIAKKSELEDFRNLKNQSANALRYYNYITSRANNHYKNYTSGAMDLSKPQRPSDDDPDAVYNYERGITTVYTKLVGYAYECGYAYLLSGDERYAEVAKAILLAISPWGFVEDKKGNLVYDVNDVTGYKNNDTIHRVITYKSAMVYDWIYHTMTEEEKDPIRHMIRERGKILANHLVDGKTNAIRKMPYDSHGWTAFGFLGITAYAMYGEFPEAEYWFENVIPAYAAILPPWSYQDGGWSQGTDYWKDSTIHGQEFLDVMARAGIINYYDSAWASQEYLWSLYAFPAGSYGAFGDDSNLRLPGTASADSVSNTAYYTKNPVAKWILNTLGGEYANTINTFYINTDDIEPEPPTDYPLSHEFQDVGWVIMTSDLMDTERVHAYFKSSPYGSFNHSHADQNSFIIQAFGEKLAIKSGYYDSYHSVHDKTITRATFAHNSITVDGGNGQPSQTDDFTAKGDITEFVTQMSFDSATGDATPAYKGALDKYVRHFIYIRPGVFVVIDDLDAKDNTKSSFEWWLNADDNKLTHYDNNSALIESGDANLRADVIYPQNTKVTHYDGFINPLDGLEYPPNASRDFDGWPEHDRINFSTQPVEKTRMIVTMSVYEDTNEADTPEVTYADDGSYVKMEFKDGNVCIVNLKGEDEYINCDGINFNGEAVTYNDRSIMLTGGKYLEKDGTCLVYSDRSLTCAMGYGQLSMSLTEDACVEIGTTTDYFKMNEEGTLKDNKGRNADSAIGLDVDYSSLDAGYIPIVAHKGNYMLLADGASVTPAGLVPDIFVNNTNDGKYAVTWSEEDEFYYDILINGRVYENVSSPYVITPSDDVKTYNVALRAKYKDIISDWSDYAYISPGGREYYSYLRYRRTDGVIKAEVFATNPANKAHYFVSVVRNADGTIAETIPLTPNGDLHTATLPELTEGQTVSTYLWDKNNIMPKTALAQLDSNDLTLKEIRLDGVLFTDYSDLVDEYDVVLPEGTDYYPLVSAISADNATKCVVSHDYSNLATYITLTAQNGSERVIRLNYVPEFSDLHPVTGASTDADFKTDTGRGKDANGNYTGNVSKSNVVTHDYEVVKDGVTYSYSKTYPVYTNIEGNKGGNHLGSRLAADRKPNYTNHTEYNDPNKSYEGYDHIVLNNVDYFTLSGNLKGGAVKNSKVRFSLDKNAEVLVVATDKISTLADDGFSLDITEDGSFGRYYNVPGPEDKYYNIAFNGMSQEDFYGNNPVNYDILFAMINVAPIEGLSSYEDYVDAAPGKSGFVTTGEAYVADRVYLFDHTYVKRYDNITEPTPVEINLGSYNGEATRLFLIVRPLTPQKPIGDFKVTAPLNFEDVPAELLAESTDSLQTHTAHKMYTGGAGIPLCRRVEAGTHIYQENTSNYIINKFNDYIGIEGAYIIPIQKSADGTETENNWMRAYYYGLAKVGDYNYPAMDKKVNDWYEFTLNRSADVYVIASGGKPAFLDDTWQKLNFRGTALVASGLTTAYSDVYVKHISVEPGEPVTVSMKTPGTGKITSQYFTVIKPTE